MQSDIWVIGGIVLRFESKTRAEHSQQRSEEELVATGSLSEFLSELLTELLSEQSPN